MNRKIINTKNRTYETCKSYLPANNAELFCNTMISLIHQTNYLLDRQLKTLTETFAKKGGLRERMYNARVKYRDAQNEKLLSLLRDIYRDAANLLKKNGE